MVSAEGEPELSVIVPTFNRAAMLASAVESILGSGIRSLEIVVVDDGSTDDTPNVVRSLGPRVHYFRQNNQGPAVARNTALSHSRGTFVAFLDSDDRWIPGQHQRLVAQLACNPDVDVVFADSAFGPLDAEPVSFLARFGGSQFSRIPREVRDDGLAVLERPGLFAMLLRRCVMFLGSSVFRRAALVRLGGFDPRIRGTEDWELFMRICATGTVALQEGSTASRYVKHDESITADTEGMRTAYVMALSSVFSKGQYPPECREALVSILRDHLFGWAWSAYDMERMREARERLGRFQSLGGLGTRERMLLCATYVPRRLLRRIRRLKQWAGRGR
jgi:glycosyltransferase involved in cell wall biosynthesis